MEVEEGGRPTDKRGDFSFRRLCAWKKGFSTFGAKQVLLGKEEERKGKRRDFKKKTFVVVPRKKERATTSIRSGCRKCRKRERGGGNKRERRKGLKEKGRLAASDVHFPKQQGSDKRRRRRRGQGKRHSAQYSSVRPSPPLFGVVVPLCSPDILPLLSLLTSLRLLFCVSEASTSTERGGGRLLHLRSSFTASA